METKHGELKESMAVYLQPKLSLGNLNELFVQQRGCVLDRTQPFQTLQMLMYVGADVQERSSPIAAECTLVSLENPIFMTLPNPTCSIYN